MIRTIMRVASSLAFRLDAIDHRRSIAVRIDRDMEVYLQAEAASVLVGHVDTNNLRRILCSIPGVAMLIVDCGIMSRIGFTRREPRTRNIGAIDMQPVIAEDDMHSAG